MYSNPWGWAILQGNSVYLLPNICFSSWSKSIIMLSCWSFSYFVVDHGPPCIYVDHCPPWKMCWLLSIISVDQIVRPREHLLRIKANDENNWGANQSSSIHKEREDAMMSHNVAFTPSRFSHSSRTESRGNYSLLWASQHSSAQLSYVAAAAQRSWEGNLRKATEQK